MIEEENIEQIPEGDTVKNTSLPGKIEVSAIAPQDTTDQQSPATENMEVHHHPHVEKKNFKEYLLEGLMIFFAVMMGFFAESLREHISEKHIEKEFIKSFVSDLKQDVTTFNILIPLEETSLRGLDTMLSTLTHSPFSDSSTRLLYYLSRKYTESIDPMSYTLRTITQLKSSGGMRLISNKNASDSIVLYNKMVDDITAILNYTTHDFMIPSIHAGNRIFNPKFLLPYNGETIINLLRPGEKISLLTTDETTLAEYTSLIYEVKQIRQNYLGQLKRHQERARDMIIFFQKEYHFDNE